MPSPRKRLNWGQVIGIIIDAPFEYFGLSIEVVLELKGVSTKFYCDLLPFIIFH